MLLDVEGFREIFFLKGIVCVCVCRGRETKKTNIEIQKRSQADRKKDVLRVQ